jgi:hypothetical protein
MIDRATTDAHKFVSNCISLHLVYHLWGMRMIVTPELKSEIEIAGISLDSALAYAERIADHGVLHCSGFDLLMEALKSAQVALDRAKGLMDESDQNGHPIAARMRRAANDAGEPRP